MLLLAVLLLGYWGLPEAGWVIMVCALAWRAGTQGRAFLSPARWPLLLFALLIVIGLPGLAQNSLTDAAKDVWYLSKPVVELAFGLLVAVLLGVRRALWATMIAALVVSLHYVGSVLAALPEYLANDTDANRVLFGPGSFLSLLACVLVLAARLRDELAPRTAAHAWLIRVTVLLSLSAMALSRSRTLGVLLALFLALRLVPRFARSAQARFAGLMAAACAGAVVLILYGSGLMSFGSPETVAKAAQEVTVADYVTDEDVGANWRGFESFMALLTFDSFSPVQKIRGGGLGTRVDLDKTRVLAGVEFDAIPVLHNGYMYVLVKTGVAGLLTFMAALVFLFRALRTAERGTPPGMAAWLAAAVALSAAVISGPYNKSELLPIMVLCGLYISIGASHGAYPSLQTRPAEAASLASREGHSAPPKHA